MKEQVRDLMHAQDGYSRINFEDGFSIPQGSELKKRGMYCRSAEFVWRCISISMFLGGVLMLFVARLRNPSDVECTAQLSVWCEIYHPLQLKCNPLRATLMDRTVAPLLEAVEYEQKNWTSGLSASEFSGPPTPELEARWSEISTSGIVLIPPERLPSLNRSSDRNFVEIKKDSISNYIGEIEVFHPLHCLIFIRQYIWSESYENQPTSLLNHGSERSDEVRRLHASHCIEVIRQALMCNADLTPYLMFKTPGEASPVKEDFNASHKCKKFDRIMDWMKVNSAAEEWAEVRNEVFDQGN